MVSKRKKQKTVVKDPIIQHIKKLDPLALFSYHAKKVEQIENGVSFLVGSRFKGQIVIENNTDGTYRVSFNKMKVSRKVRDVSFDTVRVEERVYPNEIVNVLDFINL
jgi:hypothetical protein